MSKTPEPPPKPVLFPCETPGCKTQTAHRFMRDGLKVCAGCNAKAHDALGATLLKEAREKQPAVEPSPAPAT